MKTLRATTKLAKPTHRPARVYRKKSKRLTKFIRREASRNR